MTSDRDRSFIYVADTGSDQFSKFLTTGAFRRLGLFAVQGSRRPLEIPIVGPRYVATEEDKVFVSDPPDDRVVISESWRAGRS
ncbi:MAG: hypothetical protein R3E12_14460 [Candidatus Eisenbacteria bacterium]